MAAQAIYRRWRSQTFDQLIGQAHVVKTLRNALRDDRVAHAYLFCGPRGTGKTSAARILAKAVNCLGETDEKPCNRCHLCTSINEGRLLDLIEIDGASNRGIDEIRDLREKVNFAPAEGRFKVYVIDEVHMLTREAFNALLKTLEEPPAHVIFVLCTTEPHRIPATVLSRCQRLDFRRVSIKDLTKKLTLICEGEGISIAPEAMELIARQATGSFRDAESLLDQLISYGEENQITLEQVQTMLGTATRETVSSLVDHLIEGDSKAGLRLINDAIFEGAAPRQFNAEILAHLHSLLLLKTSGSSELINVTSDELTVMQRQVERFDLGKLVRTIRLFNGVASGLRSAPQPQMPIELAFIEATMPAQEAAGGAAPAASRSTSRRDRSRARPNEKRATAPSSSGLPPIAKHSGTATTDPVERPSSKVPPPGNAASRNPPKPRIAQPEPTPADPSPTPTPGPPGRRPSSGDISDDWLRENWSRLLSEVRPYNRMAEALLRSCRPARVEGTTIVIAVRHPFHKDKIDDPRNKQVIEKVLTELTGQPSQLSCVIQSAGGPETQPRQDKDRRREILDDPLVKAARNFGGKVVDVRLDTPLESE